MKNKIIRKRQRKVWWRKNWQLVLTMTFAFIIAGIFIGFVVWYIKEVDKIMFSYDK